MPVSVSLTLLFCLGAVVSDLRRQSVDNLWVILGWLAGITSRVIREGAPGIVSFLAGAVFPIAVLWVLFLFRALGAGDLKTLSVVGGLLGLRAGAAVMGWAFLAAAALSLAILVIERSFVQRFAYFFRFIRRTVVTRQRAPYRRSATAQTELHFTVPVLMGAMLVTGGAAL